MSKLQYAVFGFNGDGGLRGRVKGLEDAREDDFRERLAGQRAVLLALLAAILGLIGTFVNLFVLVVG